MKSLLIKISVLVLMSLAVVACGGGGGGGSKNNVGGGSSLGGSSSSAVVTKLDQQPLVFSEASVDLMIDQGIYINPLTGGSGDGAVSFVSSNSDVATVNQASGEVSVVGAGSTTISVTKSADSVYNAATGTYSLTVSKYTQDPLTFEQASIQAVVNAPISGNPISGGSGSGAISYEIGDSTIASIDAASGVVSVIRPGVTSVVATKAGDTLYDSTTASYSLTAVELLSGLEVLVGKNETWLEWHDQVGVVDVVRTTNPNCNIDNISVCANRQLTTVSDPLQTPVVDSYIRTTRSAYLTFQNEAYRSNPINVSVPLAPFAKRSGGQLVSFKGKLWMIGGKDDQSGPTPNDIIWYGDIWSSEDGISWVLETSKAAFPARSDHQLLEYRDELYLIGGGQALGTDGGTWHRSDVWKSSDGVLWQQMTDWAFSGAHAAKYIVFNDKIWGIGGGIFPLTANRNIWSTTNGTDWILEVADVPFGVREEHALYIANNRMMVLGGVGEGGGDNLLSDIWSSADGINWKKEANSTSFAPRANMKVQNFNGLLWLMGGNTLFTVHNNAFKSSDGIQWTLAATDIPEVGQYDAVALHNNALWIYGGFENGMIWKSKNGTEWGVPVGASTTWTLRP